MTGRWCSAGRAPRAEDLFHGGLRVGVGGLRLFLQTRSQRPATEAGGRVTERKFVTSSRLRRRLYAGLALPCLIIALGGAPALAGPNPAPVSFNIEAGSLESALLAYAHQSGLQLLYSAELVAGRTAPALRGALAPDQALDRLLAGTGLVAQSTRPGVVVLKPARLAGLPGGSGEDLIAIAQAGSPAAITTGNPQPVRAAVEVAAAPSLLDEVVVTGSNIRGSASPTSPIIVFDREALDRAGHATVADMLTVLPQNFGASASADTGLVGSDPRNTNDTMATGVNLRGLGAPATLVLVNGRRMAGAGLRGDFADVSAIPTAAVARVDVLLDGASAIYGADAVGGVVNILLRRDFEGWETRARVGLATQGGGEEAQVAQTFGAGWSSGSLLASYEYHRREAVEGWRRAYTRSTDLRRLGGSDRRLIFAHPGNILNFDAATGSYSVGWGIPAGQSGVGLRAQDFLPGQANLVNQREDADIQPMTERHSLYLSMSQDLGERIRLFADARFSRREIELARPASLTVFNVTAANPYFVSPNGSTSHTIGYSFVDETGPAVTTGSSESFGVSGGLDLNLGHGWKAEVYGAHASETGRRIAKGLVNTRFLNEALGAIPDDPATAFVAARDGYFNPFGDTGANSPTVIAFVGSGYNRTVSASMSDSLNLKADGPVWSLPGGQIKAAAGAELRRETFEPRGVSLLSRAAPVSTGERDFKRQVAAGFLEVQVPLIGPDNATPWAERLELTLAGRIEDYDDVGRTTNPKLGLLWAPHGDLRLRASYGTSFRAPNLTEVYDTEGISPTFLANGAGQTLTLVLSGGNTELKPEEARTWTVGFDYAPEAVPGLSVSLSAFDIRFSGQIGQPVIRDTGNALTNPAYGPFVRRLQAGNPADLAAVQALIARSTSSQVGLFPPESYGAIVDARYVNAAEVRARGVDLQTAYGFTLGQDRFDLTANLSYLAEFSRKLTPTAAAVSVVDRPNEPVDLRGRATATWTRDAVSLMVAANHADNYTAPTGVGLEAWTTFDAALRWAPEAADGPLAGLALTLSAQNLFDTDPPFYDNPIGVGYDPANADPLGRVVALALTKRW